MAACVAADHICIDSTVHPLFGLHPFPRLFVWPIPCASGACRPARFPPGRGATGFEGPTKLDDGRCGLSSPSGVPCLMRHGHEKLLRSKAGQFGRAFKPDEQPGHQALSMGMFVIPWRWFRRRSMRRQGNVGLLRPLPYFRSPTQLM